MEGLKNSTHASLRSMLNQIVFSNMSQVSDFSEFLFLMISFTRAGVVLMSEVRKGLRQVSFSEFNRILNYYQYW